MILRAFKQQDQERLQSVLNTPAMVEYLSSKIPSPYTNADAQWWITTDSKEGIVNAITIDDVLVGCISAERGAYEYCRSAELGYWVAQDYWGQGIATKAIEQFVAQVFNETDIVRLFATVFADNAASMKVLKRCGFEHEATHQQAMFKNNKFYNSHIFAKLKLAM